METGKKLKHRILEETNIKQLLSKFSKQQLALTFNVTTGFIDRTLIRQTKVGGEIIQFKYFMLEKLDNAVNVVCNHYGVTIEQLKYPSRIREFTEPRKLLYYILYFEYNESPSLIAKFFNRTHGAVIVSAKNVKSRLEVDKGYNKELKEVFNALNIKQND